MVAAKLLLEDLDHIIPPLSTGLLDASSHIFLSWLGTLGKGTDLLLQEVVVL